MDRTLNKEELKSTVRDRLSEQAEKLQELGERISDTAKKFSGATNRYVHDNPWKTVAIAAGVGFLVGMLIGRRHHED